MRRAFTLIELLVSIGIIALLLGLLFPALGKAKEASRNVKCLANLSSLGKGLQGYMNDHKDHLLPEVRPLHGGDPGGGNDPSLLDILADYLDCAVPRKGDDGFFIVTDPFRCPSDRTSDDEATNFEPTWRSVGTSYEYRAGLYMLAAELMGVKRRSFAVTRALEQGYALPIASDSTGWHSTSKSDPGVNAIFWPDFAAKREGEPNEKQYDMFFQDMIRIGL